MPDRPTSPTVPRSVRTDSPAAAYAETEAGAVEPVTALPADGDSRLIRSVLLALKGGPLFILGLLVVILWITTEGHVFLTYGNIGNVLEQSAGVCVIALGQLLVILTRGIDLSIGSTVSLGCVVCTVVFRDTHSTVLAIGATLLAGLTMGAVNGIILVKGRLPHPFIATLATLSVDRGPPQDDSVFWAEDLHDVYRTLLTNNCNSCNPR